MKTVNKNKRGFTLVELLVAMTIGLLVLACVIAVFLSINRTIFGLSDAIELNSRTRVVQERVLYDLRGITSFTAISDQSFSAKYIDFHSGAELALKYELMDGKLYRTVGAGVRQAIMSDLVTSDQLNPPNTAPFSKFAFSNRCGAQLPTSTADMASVRAIGLHLVPEQTARQKQGLVHGTSDPFASALIQLRNLQS